MMEHTRGLPICCLIAHDTFGSFMTAQFVVYGQKTEELEWGDPMVAAKDFVFPN